MPGGRGVPAGGAQRHTEGDKTECRRKVQFEKVRLTSVYTIQINYLSLSLSIITYDPLEVCGSVRICRDPVLCLDYSVLRKILDVDNSGKRWRLTNPKCQYFTVYFTFEFTTNSND